MTLAMHAGNQGIGIPRDHYVASSSRHTLRPRLHSVELQRGLREGCDRQQGEIQDLQKAKRSNVIVF